QEEQDPPANSCQAREKHLCAGARPNETGPRQKSNRHASQSAATRNALADVHPPEPSRAQTASQTPTPKTLAPSSDPERVKSRQSLKSMSRSRRSVPVALSKNGWRQRLPIPQSRANTCGQT